MFHTDLLKGAFAAIACLEAAEAVATSQADIDAFPEFATEMSQGSGF